MFDKATYLEAERVKVEKRYEDEARRFNIIRALPDNLPLAPSFVHSGGYKCDGSIKFECGRDYVAFLLGLFTPLELVRLESGGFTSYQPECKLPTDYNGEVVLLEPVMLKKDGFDDTVEWFTMLGDYLVEIECVVPRDSFVRFEKYNIRYSKSGGQIEFDYRIVADFPLELVTKFARTNNTSYGHIVVVWHRREIEASPVLSLLQTNVVG